MRLLNKPIIKNGGHNNTLDSPSPIGAGGASVSLPNPFIVTLFIHKGLANQLSRVRRHEATDLATNIGTISQRRSRINQY